MRSPLESRRRENRSARSRAGPGGSSGSGRLLRGTSSSLPDGAPFPAGLRSPSAGETRRPTGTAPRPHRSIKPVRHCSPANSRQAIQSWDGVTVVRPTAGVVLIVFAEVTGRGQGREVTGDDGGARYRHDSCRSRFAIAYIYAVAMRKFRAGNAGGGFFPDEPTCISGCYVPESQSMGSH